MSDRLPLAEVTYGDVWSGRDLSIGFDPGRRCATCTATCPAEAACPVEAISWRERRLDANRCIRCGACAVLCPGGAFRIDLGTLRVLGQERPIIFRLSDRLKAMELAERLKAMMLRGEFLLASGTTPITPGGAPGRRGAP